MTIAQEYERNMVLETGKYNTIGKRPLRSDGYDRITGRAVYTADIQLTGMLHAKVLRSPHAHANIRSIDTSEAEKRPGVRAVITCKDFNFTEEQRRDLSGFSPYVNMIACDKALYPGHPVAAVAADDPQTAEEALELIKVDYEVLPFVLTAPEAMKDDAPILHDFLTTKDVGKDTGKVSNVASHLQHKKGDVEDGLKQADVIVEREFNSATVHQGYIEPHASVAMWNANDTITLWTSTQGNFTARDYTARVVGVPDSQIKTIPTEIGGGFGGKLPVYLDPLVVMLSKKAGRPVKATMNRKEVLESTGPTPGSYIRVKIGAKKDGTITALQSYMAYEAGAFPGSAIARGSVIIFAPYDVENALVDGYDVVVNKPKSQAYRAPGATNAAWACETVLDEVAEKLGMDPVDLRIKNGAKEGTRRHDGLLYPRIGFIEVMEATKEHPHYRAPLEKKNDGKLRGRGMGAGFWVNAGAASSANVTVHYDGTVSLVEGSVDLAGSKTAIAMQVAETLGIPLDDVHTSVGDTESVGWTHFTAGSRTIFATGIAAYEATQDVIEKMKDRASQIWDIPVDQVDFKEGVFSSKSDPSTTLTFKQLANQLQSTGGTVTGAASVDPKGVGSAFGCHIVDVEVDPETGKTDILRYTVVQDVGKAVHPSYVEGQMQGGAVQGIGWALNEEYYYNDKGVMANSSWLDYRMPTSLDVPLIDTVIVEVPNPGHPYGVRGVGECNIVPPAGAIGNAIYDAIGIRMETLPMKPGAILEALWSTDKKNGHQGS